MKRQIFSFLSFRSLVLPSAATTITLIIYLILSMGLAYFMLLDPLLGLVGALVINLIVLFFMRPRLALPFYILVAAPSIALSLIGSGILSRLYIGDLLFVLVVGIWLLRTVLSERKSGHINLEPSLLVPFTGLILIGLSSIIYSRLFPDPNVPYSFVHSNVSITIVNITEMALLIGLPMFLVIVPGVVRTVRDFQWALGSYIGLGMLYALGTIFAAPLELYSQEVILGNRRPQVFGSVSSGLGVLLVIFTCIAFGQALYTRKRVTRWCWSLFTIIFAIAVIMSFGREAWIGLFLSVLVMIGFRLKNWSVLLILLVFLLLILFIPGVTDFFNPGKVYGIDRLQVWQDAIAIWQHSPYMGVGAGNFQFFDLTYGKDVVGVAHNQYLEVLAEMGVQGLLCLLWILITVGRMMLKRFKTASTSLSKGLALAWIGYYVTIIVGGFFTDSFVQSAAGGGGTASFVVESYTWLLLGLVLSIPNWEKEAEQSEQRNIQTDKKVAVEIQQEAVAGQIEVTDKPGTRRA
jgi:O-antigen ligase